MRIRIKDSHSILQVIIVKFLFRLKFIKTIEMKNKTPIQIRNHNNKVISFLSHLPDISYFKLILVSKLIN